MQRLKIGVIRGGRDPGFGESIESGKCLLENIDNDKYEPVDIWISKEGVWHIKGFEVFPRKALSQIDLVLNSISNISKNKVNDTLESFGIPYTGSRQTDSIFAYNKFFTEEKI